MEPPIEILRDALGVPHVRARDVTGAFFGQGFAHAQDRLWQMDLDRKRAAGRSSTYLGRAGLTLDVFARRMGLAAAARADLAVLDAETRAILDAYAAGVNAFMEGASYRELTRRWPADIAKWPRACRTW